MAEDVGFEPTGPFRPPAFKAGAINRSANLPWSRVSRSLILDHVCYGLYNQSSWGTVIPVNITGSPILTP